MKVGNKISFYIDIEIQSGIIKRIDDETADVLIPMGLITNIPISELFNRE